MLKFFKRRHGGPKYDSAVAYQRHLDSLLRRHKGARDLAFAEAVGSVSLELFEQQGDGHVAVLRHAGLTDGMAVFDLGCGCGRTAQALYRAGWKGAYAGSDIIPGFVAELLRKCPGYRAVVHTLPTIPADDRSIDLIYHWSVFTHLSVEECFLYLSDSFRALKPGGKTVFSFLELTSPLHRPLFAERARQVASQDAPYLMDTFLHRDWICIWAEQIGFLPPVFTDGDDDTHHPAFWQSLTTLVKPLDGVPGQQVPGA